MNTCMKLSVDLPSKSDLFLILKKSIPGNEVPLLGFSVM